MENSFNDIENKLKIKLIKAQEDAIQVMLLKLDEFIQEDVYNYYATDNENAGETYVPTREVFEMFDSIKSYIKGNTVYGAIGVAGTKGFKNVNIIHRKSTWTHDTQDENGDFYLPKPADIVTIINEGLSEEESLFGRIYARPFWDNFKKWCLENYTDILLDCCLKNDIPVKRQM